MTLSMTGFASSRLSYGDLEIQFELKTVNGKYKDIKVNLPKDFTLLEKDILYILKANIARATGYFSLKVTNSGGTSPKLDRTRIKSLYQDLLSIKEDLGLGGQVSLEEILALKDLFINETGPIVNDGLKNFILASTKDLVLSLNQYRVIEGSALEIDIREKLGDFKGYIFELQDKSLGLKDAYKLRLARVLEDLLDVDEAYMDKRLASEILIFAEKADISEEILRLKSHLDMFNESLDGEGPVGKKLDFICQELLRETNTIGSKSNSKEISSLVIEMKTLIDQVKEQVQNIE